MVSEYLWWQKGARHYHLSLVARRFCLPVTVEILAGKINEASLPQPRCLVELTFNTHTHFCHALIALELNKGSLINH